MKNINIKISKNIIENKNLFSYVEDMLRDSYGNFSLCEKDYDYYVYIEGNMICIKNEDS